MNECLEQINYESLLRLDLHSFKKFISIREKIAISKQA